MENSPRKCATELSISVNKRNIDTLTRAVGAGDGANERQPVGDEPRTRPFGERLGPNEARCDLGRACRKRRHAE